MRKNSIQNSEDLGNQDFYASAYLIASGYPLKSHFRENGITIFKFENSDSIQDALDQYYSLGGSINPALYVSAIKNLKNIIHNNSNYNSKPYNNNGTKWHR
jgi:hypothetical protein